MVKLLNNLSKALEDCLDNSLLRLQLGLELCSDRHSSHRQADYSEDLLHNHKLLLAAYSDKCPNSKLPLHLEAYLELQVLPDY